MSDLYVVVDSTTGEPILGGGSSSPAFIRAFTDESKARRSAKRITTTNMWGKSLVTGTPVVAKFVREDHPT